MRPTRILQVQPNMPGERDTNDPLSANKDAFLACLEAAGRFDPDFVVFPELVLADDTGRHDRPVSEVAIELPGPFTDRVAEAAATLEAYVWVPTYEVEGDTVYNAVALIGPAAGYRGTYRKIAPTIGELEDRGIAPGTELPVWDTPFGRVGATICWDVRFDELALAYRRRELDLMVHPTHGLGWGKFAHWATYHGFHIAYCFPSDAKVYTPHGHVVGRGTGHPTMPTVDFDDLGGARFHVATVNTNMRSYDMGSFDYSDTELTAIQEAYPESVAIHTPQEEGIIVLESRDEMLDIVTVEREFDLLTTEAAERRTRELARNADSAVPLLEPRRLERGDAPLPAADD